MLADFYDVARQPAGFVASCTGSIIHRLSLRKVKPFRQRKKCRARHDSNFNISAATGSSPRVGIGSDSRRSGKAFGEFGIDVCHFRGPALQALRLFCTSRAGSIACNGNPPPLQSLAEFGFIDSAQKR